MKNARHFVTTLKLKVILLKIISYHLRKKCPRVRKFESLMNKINNKGGKRKPCEVHNGVLK